MRQRKLAGRVKDMSGEERNQNLRALIEIKNRNDRELGPKGRFTKETYAAKSALISPVQLRL
jgi:hypothetical protein